MSDNPKTNKKKKSLHLAFDVGHSSIGWAVLDTTAKVDILGCGSVIFRADDCLASERRVYRRQRRNIRSTRQRIERLKILLDHLGCLSKEQLDAVDNSSPWKQAAQVLQGGDTLTWEGLWNVLRWYAHNRGYDGNRGWSNQEDAGDDDVEKVQNANALMDEHNTATMAETVCAVIGIDPLGGKSSAAVDPKKRFKSQNAAFDRDIVRAEVRKLLEAHVGKLEKLDGKVIRCLIGDDSTDKDSWTAVPTPKIKLPKRYAGSLLFGQLIPRFDNRIISTCPISGGKVPTRHCREFLEYRWAMQLANVRVAIGGEKEMRTLSGDELASVHESMLKKGFLTKGDFKKAVRNTTNCDRDNLDTTLLHPDAEKALILDPVRKFAQAGRLSTLFPLLPKKTQQLAINRWRRGKAQTLSELQTEAEKRGEDTSAFATALQNLIDNPPKSRGKKKTPPPTLESLLNETHAWDRGAPGRAPYARSVLTQAATEVMAGKHPVEQGGCLYVTDEMRHEQLNYSLADQTNNHLVRHRLLILGRLIEDIVSEYADGDKDRVAKATIEVNREVREMSGKSAKAVAQDLGLRLADHKRVGKKLEEEMAAMGKPITASLIRKARVAQDLGWTCPFTGKIFDVHDLVNGSIDREHIIPRSLRQTDALDALVMTFSAVNKMKGKRTAMQFIEEEGGNPVQGAPQLTLFTPQQYRTFVDKLESYNGHSDDKRRKKRRKEWLLLKDYEDKEFTPGDLTQTSQLVRLGAQVISRNFKDRKKSPQVISLPGSVTGAVRKSWRLLGCLAKANPQILNEDGSTKTKTEVRGITHLHHALDACVQGLSSHFIPNNGRVWELIVKRKHTPPEQAELMKLGVFGMDSEKRFRLRDLNDRLKKQVGKRLAECRVVQHLPAKMSGLRVEQNTWRILGVEDGVATLRQQIRSEDGTLTEAKETTENIGKLLGPKPSGQGKLATIKGALVIPDNFGVALDPEPTVIPFHKVWPRLIGLKQANKGKWPRVLRNGNLISVKEGRFKGIWRVFSSKNNKSGMALDIGRPDVVRLQNKVEGHKINVRLASLIKSHLTILRVSLTGRQTKAD
ncbi:hypothetical protein OAF50_01130 [bacterium]|nr:hypothetical protein [bacterium]